MNILFKKFKLVQKIIVNSIFVLLRLSFKWNSRHFYGRYYGTDHPLEIVIKNFLRPNRIIKKFIYGQIILWYAPSLIDTPIGYNVTQ